MKIAVLGIGLMGFPMGRRLCEAGHAVQAWNRTQEKAQRLASLGATVHAKVEDAVRDADAVITLLDNGGVVGQVLFEMGAADAMKPQALMIDMSSIKPAQARDHAARLSERHIAYLDAPVSGGTLGAKTARWPSWLAAKPALLSARFPY